MIELYGNKIWNSNTPNKYKKVIIASEDSLDNICQELENSGLNYCAYIFNGEAHIAIGRATANNIDKLDIDYQTVIECNSKVYKTNNIIGTTTYDSIEDKLYRKYNTDFAYKIGQRLTEQGILFSGRIYGKTTTITVDKQYADTLNKISAELKEQRASFMSKSEVVQNESPEESKSVNEKISELHFNESQLSALAPSVKFIQTRNDDNLTDNFVSLFSDCTDFYESQLSALAEIYVDTYRSFSDKSLIFADTSRFNDLKQRFVNDNITAKLTENRGYSTTQFEIIREMVTYGMSESVINLLDYTFSIDEMQNFFTAYKNGSYEDLINLIADIKGTTRTDIEGQIEGGTYTPALPDFNTLEKTLYFQESEVESITYMYYNPDAYSGGQFVITEVSYKQIAEANKEYGDDFSGFFDFLDTTGEQRLIDIGSESFRTAIKKFYSGTEFAEGLNADIQHKLVELAVVPEIKLPEVRKIELIKVGDFYEVRGENAKTVADILDLVSTTRNINGSSVDTVGFPDFKLNDNTELLKTQGFTVNIKYEELAPFYEEHDELDDIDPAVIRQQLEDAGIVNGELVDEDKLNSDPFIQQVMAVAESDAGALNVSSEEIVNQFNSENEIVPINEPERTESVQKIIRPTITCDWSESPVFENGKTYSVSEFDKLMKNADDEWVEQRQLEIEEYGSENAVAEAYRNGELDNIHLGYEKTKFIINMPNGTKHTERQDIGDGIGGVIDFLEQYPQYSDVVKLLKDDIAFENRSNELLKPLLAFDEQVAIVNEFFDYEKAWHNVDDGISEIAEKYRNGDNIDVELAKHFINHYTNLNSAEITDDYEIQITSDGVSIQNSQFFQAYNWDTLGTHYFKYLYDTFNSIKEEQAAEYPEKESAAEEINNNTELHSVDELAMQLENDEKSTSEKSSVGKNNFMWATGGDTDEHAQTTSQPTLFDSIPVSDVSSDEITSHENYVLEDRESVTGAKTKFRNNITAIKILKQIETERQKNIFKEQIDNIVAGIAELKYQEGNSFKVKDMERTKRSLEQQLEKLQSSKKDNTVYFEELGIDKLFVDEAHEFKNLFCTTKLQNVSGISSRASQRAIELFAKCRYLDEKTGGKGVVFATGTPLSNSVTELHTMMRYLNYDFLASHNNMQNFDNWVSTFGVQKKEYELAPAGNKFKERTRIAEYANLPELMSMFKTIADVRTADTLNLKVPDCELHIVDVEPTELQTELVEELSDRADEVNNGSVDPSQDNMLKITGDGRKLGLDPRLINPSFEDDPGTKLNVCVNNVFDIYEKTSDKKLTQIVFCDLGVPSKNSSADGNKDDDTKSVAELDSLEESGKFCVYDDIRDKLIAKGVSADEIAYIHNAKSETQKSELFAKVRSGEVRILLGSTGKMGTGTNVQDRIIALHDLDVPWRPSDLEQRRGRMVRQGNINDKVHLYRYVTKGTFDAYSYQLLEKKQKFISQIMTSKEPGRKCADVDQAALTYSEIKALCTGDERIREKLTLENRVKELQALKSEYNSTRYELEDKVNAYPEERKKLLLDIGNISKDMETVKNIPFDVKTESYRVGITIGKDAYSLLDDESRKVAAKALTNAVAQVKGDANKNKRIAIGGLGNFGVEIINDGYFLDKITATLRGNYTYSVELGVSSIINLKKIENLLFKVENVLNDKKSELNKLDIDYKTAQNMLHKPFEFEDELNNSTKRLDELTTALNIDMSEHKVDKPKKTHYFGKDFILGKNKSSKQIQNNEVMKSEPKRSEQEL